jgi:TonB family protein
MATTFKSFQFSVLFHLALGALFVFSIPKKEQSEYLAIQDNFKISLVGLKTGSMRGQNSNIFENKKIANSSNLIKNNSTEASKTHTESLDEISAKLAGSGSATNGTSLSGNTGGGTSDFNESVLSYYEPQYPKAALRRGLQGTLRVKILIGNQGIPTETQILLSSGHKILDDSAIEAISKWVFKNKNHSTYYVVKTIIFQIKN